MEKLTIEEAKQLKELFKRFLYEMGSITLWRDDSEALLKVRQLMDRFLPKEE